VDQNDRTLIDKLCNTILGTVIVHNTTIYLPEIKVSKEAFSAHKLQMTTDYPDI